ncbi:AAA family ATPase [Aeribacillus sp. FSL K6-2848]|uniref:AAA family ATPase n=1 Tax=Aeribacillus sp. FSL K6-2848 TaxID=2954612 RepID=UPI0030FAC6FE
MNKYIIKKIYIENFKSIDKATIHFKGENLNILDGPNGFGKTTIFDAIELTLTGKIRRIESNRIVPANKGFEDLLLSKNQRKPTIIKIEFSNLTKPNDNIVLARKLNNFTDLTSKQKRPEIFDQYYLYKLESFDDEITETKRIKNEKVNELFGINNLHDRFHLYHYVEQEECTFLFKQNEKDRMIAVSKLFNIEKETNQNKFFEKIKGKLITKRTNIKREIEAEKRNYNEEDLKKENKELEYFPLISDSSIEGIPWDQKEIKPLDKSIKDQYMNQLDEVMHFIKFFSEFKKELKNEEIDNIIKNENKIKALIIFSHFKYNFSELEKKHKLQKKLETILEILINKDIIEKTIDWSFLYNTLNIEINVEEIINKINIIKSINNQANELSKLVEKMNETREKLQQQFEKYIQMKKDKDNQCPLCGADWDSFLDLTEHISIKTKEFYSDYDKSTNTVVYETEELYKKYLSAIIKEIENFLSKPENKIDETFMNQLKKYSGVSNNIQKAKNWFKELGINIEKYINREMKYVEDLEERVEQITNDLISKKIEVSDECKEKMNSFKRLYSDLFRKNDELIQSLDVEKIQKKKRYIDYLYLLQSSQSYKKVQALRKKLEKIENLITSLENIIRVYNNKINEYRGKMISDIEIPFYIYSGKIIQNHQRGLGVFIKEKDDSRDNQLKTINFIPPEKTDHDIVHSFSSGQLAATVIAFTLALNKVYNKNGIFTLLIDDPIHTMDEMNMASFVELLRNDFENKQIILSTHEDKVSLYIRYKFLKYNYSVGNINVKDHLYIEA